MLCLISAKLKLTFNPGSHAPRGNPYPDAPRPEPMTRTRYRFLPDDPCPYFITATTVNWIALFSNPTICGILLDSLQYLIDNQRLILHAYVILENHLHLVASSENLAKEIANFKSFTARKCIDYYVENQNQFVLASYHSID